MRVLGLKRVLVVMSCETVSTASQLVSKASNHHNNNNNNKASGKQTCPETTLLSTEWLSLLGSCPSQGIMAARQGQKKRHPLPRHDDETVTNQLILSLQILRVAVPRDLSFSLSLGASESRDSVVFMSLIQSPYKSLPLNVHRKAEMQRRSPSLHPAALCLCDPRSVSDAQALG